MVKAGGDVKALETRGYIHSIAVGQPEIHEFATPEGEIEVSVVVSTFNHRDFVLRLLDALREQEGACFEVVLVDNGSEDGSFDAILARSRQLGLPGRVIRLPKNMGRAVARNVGVVEAKGQFIAFTDADCVPAADWLRNGVRGFSDRAVGCVQGVTRPHPAQRQPFFNHFIQIESFDGTFSTCNVFYRRDALIASGGFDPTCDYWEDLDLGWKVQRKGWLAVFLPSAVVYHQVLPLSPAGWLLWPLHFRVMPEKVSRYPEYRRYLFLGIWVNWFHALFDLALLSLPMSFVLHRRALALAVPYLVAFPFKHGLRGRYPPLKAGLHLVWDATSFFVLLLSSLKHRKLVL